MHRKDGAASSEHADDVEGRRCHRPQPVRGKSCSNQVSSFCLAMVFWLFQSLVAKLSVADCAAYALPHIIRMCQIISIYFQKPAKISGQIFVGGG